MEKKDFARRLVALRMDKNVSAREMSLALGQSPGYINNIENGANYPSMAIFFYICEYLDVTPEEFFAEENAHPAKVRALAEAAQHLSAEQVDRLTAIARELK